MNHPHEDQLLLLAYGEGQDDREVEMHVATCPACRDQLERLETARVALDWAVPKARRSVRWRGAALAGLAAAAAVTAIWLSTRPSPEQRPRIWPVQQEWSATAGYIAGGQPLITIDAQLTRLEQERPYVLP